MRFSYFFFSFTLLFVLYSCNKEAQNFITFHDSNYNELVNETTLVDLNSSYDLIIKVGRIFNTYGSRMRVNDGRAIPAFMGQVLRNESLTVFGDGSQTRSFCYINDMIEGIYKLLHSNYSKPMNLGNPEEISLIDIANEIIEMGKNNNKIIFKPLPINDPIKRKPDITKAMNILNWKPKVSRKKGLEKTLNYFKNLSLKELNKKQNKFK